MLSRRQTCGWLGCFLWATPFLVYRSDPNAAFMLWKRDLDVAMAKFDAITQQHERVEL